MDKLSNTVFALVATCQILKGEVKGLKETVFNKKKRKKRKKGIFEQLRAEEGVGGLFLSPNKVQQARDLYTQ